VGSPSQVRRAQTEVSISRRALADADADLDVVASVYAAKYAREGRRAQATRSADTLLTATSRLASIKVDAALRWALAT
jgi:hypothetical protein